MAERLVRGVEPVDWEGVEEEDLDPLPSLEAPLAAWRKKGEFAGIETKKGGGHTKVEAKDSDAATSGLSKQEKRARASRLTFSARR